MTTFQDSFATFNGANWQKVLTGGGDIIVLNDLISSTGAANYIFHATGSQVPTIPAGGPPITITVPSAHGFAVGKTFQIELVATSAAPDIDGIYTATSVTSTSFSIPAGAGAGSSDGTVRYGEPLTGDTQSIEVFVFSLAQGATQSAIIWGRFDEAGGPIGSVTFGYGAQLSWGANGARTVSIVKIDPAIPGAIQTLATKTVVLQKKADGSSDLQVRQHLGFTIADVPEQRSQLIQQPVILRAYLNETDDGNPTIEHIDQGYAGAAVSQPLHRGNGTWAITFGAVSDIQYDEFAARDDYVIPDFGVFGRQFRTLLQVRESTIKKLTVGGVANYDATLVNMQINESIKRTIRNLGDKALFMERFIEISMTADTTFLVTLPEDVERVKEVWDVSGRFSLQWRRLYEDERGRQRIVIEPIPAERAVLLQYYQDFEPVVNDTDLIPIPRKFDDVVEWDVVRTISLIEREQAFHQATTGYWREARDELVKEMNRVHRSNKAALHVPIRRGWWRHRWYYPGNIPAYYEFN